MGGLDIAQELTGAASAIAGLSSTDEQIKALKNYDAGFADWLKLGLGKFSQANTVLKTGQGIVNAWNAYSAGQDFSSIANAATSGQGVGAFGTAGEAVAEYLPYIGLGLTAYNMATAGDTAGMVQAGITTGVPSLIGLSSAGAIGGPVTAAMYAALGIAQAVGANHNKPSRDYFDPFYASDLGNGKFLMIGKSRGDLHDQTPAQDIAGVNEQLDNGHKQAAFIYDKNSNSFYSVLLSDLLPDELYTQQDETDKMLELAYPDASTYVRKLEDPITKEIIDNNAQRLIDNGDLKKVTYALFKDTPVVAHSGKDPIRLDSLQSALKVSADYNGWDFMPGGNGAGDDMAITVTDKDKYMADYGITEDAFNKQVEDGIINFTTTVDAVGDNDDDTTNGKDKYSDADEGTTANTNGDTGTTPTVNDIITPQGAEQTATAPAAEHPVYRTQAELEELFGMQPGALAEMAEQVKQATADVDTAYNSKISRPGGLNVIPLGQQKAAEARLAALEKVYNPYDYAAKTAGAEEIVGNKNWYDQQIINQRHQLGLADRNQANALKKDYALWAKDNDIIRDYDTDLTTGQKLAAYAKAIKAAGASVGDIIKVGKQAIKVTQEMWDKIKNWELSGGSDDVNVDDIGFGGGSDGGLDVSSLPDSPYFNSPDNDPIDLSIFDEQYDPMDDSLFGGSTF